MPLGKPDHNEIKRSPAKKIHFQLLQAAVPLAGTAPEQAKQIVSEHHKAAKQYKKAFDFVLNGKLR